MDISTNGDDTVSYDEATSVFITSNNDKWFNYDDIIYNQMKSQLAAQGHILAQ